ncbi:MAG: hypothetical protein KJI69_00770 [Patescibacteria group bacterium]|nr:hypothetical protein [Patescibacteria group bacterium]
MFLITEAGQPVDALCALVERHSAISSSSYSDASDLSDGIQKSWIRKTPHQYQIPGGPPKLEDVAILRQLGMISEVPAPRGEFDGALVLGGTLLAVRKRILFLKEQYEKGTQVDKIYLLGGARVLNSETEDIGALNTPLPGLPFGKVGWRVTEEHLSYLQTEADMMAFILAQSDLPLSWTGIPVKTPLCEDGSVPDTTDTVKRFLFQENPEPGEYLVVSGQPYVARQTYNVQECMRALDFSITPSGYQVTPTLPLNAHLDEVAKLLFEEVRLFKGL